MITADFSGLSIHCNKATKQLYILERVEEMTWTINIIYIHYFI